MGKGIAPWFDEEDIRPGLLRAVVIEAQIEAAKSVAVFVGKEGMTPWQRLEHDAHLQKHVHQGRPVIPVLLDGAPDEPQLPPFLGGFRPVDFRVSVPPAYLPRKIISSMLLDEDKEKVVAESEEYDQNDDWDFFLGEERSLEQDQQPIDLLVWGITGEKPKSLW